MYRRQGLIYFAAFIVAMVVVACDRAGPQANNLGNEALADQDYQAALESYQQAQQEVPGLAEPLYNSGNAYYRQQEFPSAQESYQQGLLDADDNLTQRGVFNMGNAFFNTEEYEKAIEAYKDALRLDPSDQDAKHNLELALNQLQQLEEQQPPPQGQGEQQQDDQDQQQQDQQNQPQQQEGEQQTDNAPRPDDSDESEQQTAQLVPPPINGLTEEQANQLLQSIPQVTLSERIQRTLFSPSNPPEQDW